MRPPRPTSTALALHRVFVSTERTWAASIPHIPAVSLHPRRPSQHPFAFQRRAYLKAVGIQRRPPRDEEIKARLIRLVDEQGHIQPPAPPSRILASFDRSKNFLIQVADSRDEMTGPVCKIVDKQEHRQVEKARGRQPKNFNNVVKQVEINWAIDANDLGHRLDRMEEFLGKGMRVEVVMASKRKGKGRRATPEEAGAVLAKIRSRLKDLNGVRETKNMEGKILGNATLFYEGRQQRKASAVPSQIEASATASSEMSN